MQDWIAKLNDFLGLSDYDILEHAGKISHEEAVQKAELEFEKFKKKRLSEPSRAEQDFEEAIKKLPSTTKKNDGA